MADCVLRAFMWNIYLFYLQISRVELIQAQTNWAINSFGSVVCVCVCVESISNVWSTDGEVPREVERKKN